MRLNQILTFVSFLIIFTSCSEDDLEIEDLDFSGTYLRTLIDVDTQSDLIPNDFDKEGYVYNTDPILFTLHHNDGVTTQPDVNDPNSAYYSPHHWSVNDSTLFINRSTSFRLDHFEVIGQIVSFESKSIQAIGMVFEHNCAPPDSPDSVICEVVPFVNHTYLWVKH